MNTTQLSLNSLVLLLLHGEFFDCEIKPLTTTQYERLEYQLSHSRLKEPAGLLGIKESELATYLALDEKEAEDLTIRLSKLEAMLVGLRQLEMQGIHLVTKYEQHFPHALFSRIKKHAPLILYYTGDYDLLSEPSIGVFGPQKLNSVVLENTRKIIRKINDEGYHLMTGDVDGVQDLAISTQLHHNGKVVLFSCRDMNELKGQYKKALKQRKLLIISHLLPGRCGDIVEGVVRNSFIYALSDATIIAQSSLSDSALWFSAIQNIKNRWSRVLAVVDEDFYYNAKLVGVGAKPLTMGVLESDASIEEILERSTEEEMMAEPYTQLSIFDLLEESNHETEI